MAAGRSESAPFGVQLRPFFTRFATEPENAAERRVLGKCGLRREGSLREAGFRDGRWRDIVVYGWLREEDGA